MKCIQLESKEAFDAHVLAFEGEYQVFNANDEYHYYVDLGQFVTREQIIAEVEEYVAKLKAIE